MMTEPGDIFSGDDAALVRRILAGQREAFDALMARYESVVFRYLLHRSGHRQDAEDLLQSTFIRAYRKLHRYTMARPFEAWIITLARHQHEDFYRSRRRRAAREEALGEALSDVREKEGCQRMMEAESCAALWAVVRKNCSVETCDAIYFAYQEGWDHEAIAMALGCRVGRVRTLLHRARVRLAPLLVEHAHSYFTPKLDTHFRTQGVSS